MSLLISVLVFSCTLCALCARVLGLLSCSMNSVRLHAWRSTYNCVLGVLHKMACFELLN